MEALLGPEKYGCPTSGPPKGRPITDRAGNRVSTKIPSGPVPDGPVLPLDAGDNQPYLGLPCRRRRGKKRLLTEAGEEAGRSRSYALLVYIRPRGMSWSAAFFFPGRCSAFVAAAGGGFGRTPDVPRAAMRLLPPPSDGAFLFGFRATPLRANRQQRGRPVCPRCFDRRSGELGLCIKYRGMLPHL